MTSAITYQEDRAFLELTAQEWIFPVLTPDEQFKLLFHMKPYRPYSVKKFYDEMFFRKRSRSGTERVFVQPDTTDVKQFIDEHFLKLGGVELEDGGEPTREQQLDWLKSHEDMKVQVFRQGYDGAAKPEESNGHGHKAGKAKFRMLLPTSDHKVSSRWKLYDADKDQEVDLLVTHQLSRLSQVDKDKYNKSINLVEDTHHREQYIQANWDVIEQLYDAKVKQLEGALVDGKPCDQTNLDQWRPLVPFCMKAFVMGQVVSEIDLKNA